MQWLSIALASGALLEMPRGEPPESVQNAVSPEVNLAVP